MKKTIYIVLLLLMSGHAFAQSDMEQILLSIEQNNSTLKALQKEMEAQKLSNRTGIFLEDPEVEFNYLWGTPDPIGNRNDLTIKQTFDFATISGRKSKLADKQNMLIDLEYKSNRLAILSEAKQYLIELVYYNSLREELGKRSEHAQTIANIYKKRLDEGDANILEYNKAQLNHTMVLGELAALEVERAALQSNLRTLNGGSEIDLTNLNFGFVPLPDNFETWYETAQDNNPLLAYIKQEVEVNKQQVLVNKAMGLPSFSAGFMREKVVGEAFTGLTVGVSVPLWNNKHRVKQAKTAIIAAEEKKVDAQLQFYHRLQTLYQKAQGLRATADAYRKSLALNNSAELLSKALDAGEITLLEYMIELGLYYENVNRTLEAERDFYQSVARLTEVEL